MAAAFYWADDLWETHKHLYPDAKITMKPSEYIRKHCYFSFIRDVMSMKLRNYLPVDNLTWGSDFPHSVGSFPESRTWLGRIFEGVPEDLERKILVETPCKFFNLDPTKAITETPGVTAAR